MSVQGAAEIPNPPAARLAAIVVSYRTGEALFDCLASLTANESVCEIILVDNGNPPEHLARAEEMLAACADTRIISGHGNVGFAKGCNFGARAAKAEHLLFLNPDAALQPGALTTLSAAEPGRAHPLILGGRVLGPDGVEQRGARRGEFTMWSSFVALFGLHRLSGGRGGLRNVNQTGEPLPEGPVAVGAVSGAFMMMSRADFDALSGFDEGYFIHVEDVDICRRAREAGGEVIFVPDAEVRHIGATSGVSSMTVAWHKGKSFARYFRKFARSPVERACAFALSPAIIAAALAHGAARRLFRR